MARVVPLLVLVALLLVFAVLTVSSALRSARPRDPRRYRPGRSRGASDMEFEDVGAASQDKRPAGDGADRGADLTDFLTGASIDPSDGVVRCDACRALYHPASAALLDERNGGGCASCGSASLVRLDDEALRRYRRRDAETRSGALVADLVPSDGYDPLVGRVVTVTGRVLGALPSRRAGERALRFQDLALGTECRLSFIGNAATGLRGKAFVNGLIGSRVRLRALLLRHDAHGFQLLVPDPAMVLDVEG
jgi:hypothetical protein